MKLMCKLFGHKWEPVPFTLDKDHCVRCGEILNHDIWRFIHKLNCSDLDKSENVFGEE